MRKLLFAAAIFVASIGCTNNQPAQTECCKECKNPVIENIMARRSVRAYKEQTVPRELLEQVVECGINAPNAMNAQQWEVRVVESKAWIDKATEAYKQSVKGTPAEKMVTEPSFKNMFRNAPAVIFVAAQPSAYAGVDCGILGQNIMLAAYELGLGTCCLGSPVGFMNSEAGAKFLADLNLPEGYALQFAIAIGYPDQSPEAKPRDESKIAFVE